jgi:AraC family transcriptional regulator
MKSLMSIIAAAFVLAMIAGCPPAEQPKVEKPAEPAFVAEVKTLDPVTVAMIAKTGPYSGAGDAMKALMAWVGERKVQPAGGPFGMYLDDPAKVKPESLRYAVCVAVPAATKPDAKAGIQVKKLDAMTVACAVHAGPYDKVSETYAKLAAWVATNKYEQAGPGLEFYLSPENTPVESLRTEVALVVKPVAVATDSAAAPAVEKKDDGAKKAKEPTTK